MRVTRQGGILYEPAAVDPQATVGPFTGVSDYARIYRDAVITGSEEKPSLVSQNATIFSGKISSSIISGSVKIAGNPTISNSIICGELIADSVKMDHAGLFHFSEAWGDAVISHVIVDEQARVYGSAILDGSKGTFTVSGRSRIDRGVWTRPPRTLALDADDYLTESVGGVMVNCAFRDHATWLKIGRRVGKFRGWSPEKIDLALDTIRAWSVS